MDFEDSPPLLYWVIKYEIPENFKYILLRLPILIVFIKNSIFNVLLHSCFVKRKLKFTVTFQFLVFRRLFAKSWISK